MKNTGCIGCHQYKESMVTVPPESRGPEFTTMADRIRPDWFHRWVRDPQRIQPNTAMPNFFSGKPEVHVQRELSKEAGVRDAGVSLDRDLRPRGVAQTGWRILNLLTSIAAASPDLEVTID